LLIAVVLLDRAPPLRDLSCCPFSLIDLNRRAGEFAGKPNIAPGAVYGGAGGNQVAEDCNPFRVAAVGRQIDAVAIRLRQIEDAFGRLAQLAVEIAFRPFDGNAVAFSMDCDDDDALITPHRAADVAFMAQPAAQETIGFADGNAGVGISTLMSSPQPPA